MKKWHMESIVSVSNVQKLFVPEAHQMYPESFTSLKTSDKEFFLIPPVRFIVAMLLRIF